MSNADKKYYYGTGRRKDAVARVRLIEGTGKITVNGKDLDEYFGLETLKVIVKQPLTVTNTTANFYCKRWRIHRSSWSYPSRYS